MSETKTNYEKSAELLKVLMNMDYKNKMEGNELFLGTTTKFNDFSGNRSSHSLKLNKHLGLIIADDPQVQFNSFSVNHYSSHTPQPPKPLSSNVVSESDYASVVKQFSVEPEYLQNLINTISRN